LERVKKDAEVVRWRSWRGKDEGLMKALGASGARDIHGEYKLAPQNGRFAV